MLEDLPRDTPTLGSQDALAPGFLPLARQRPYRPPVTK